LKDLVTSVCEGGICTLSLNRPEKLNAINEALVHALCDAVGDAQDHPDARVLILRGEGRAFCAGNDLDETPGFLADGADRAALDTHADRLQEISRRLCFGDKIVIGAVHGWAVGAGFEWALNCDFTVWGSSARAFLPELSLGVFPTGGAMTLLPQLVGLHKAREMFLLGERYGSHELEKLGIATRVVADDDVLEEARRLAARILDLPGDGVARFKRTLRRTAFLDLEQTLALESKALVDAVLTSASGEGADNA
jgi:enoyl-CoA hydratase/carnithine racemase